MSSDTFVICRVVLDHLVYDVRGWSRFHIFIMSKRRHIMLGFVAFSLILPSITANAAPFRPRDSGEVLERLPTSVTASRSTLARLQRLARRSPADLGKALELADTYLQMGRKEADPRLYSYAEGVLRPWIQSSAAPPAVILRRAAIRQFRHDFDGALQDLQGLAAAGYDDPQVALLAASILRIRGRYEPAMRSCLPLLAAPNQLPAVTCATEIQSLGADADMARQALSRAIDFEERKRVGDLAPANVIGWSKLVLAGMDERAGDTAAAERLYKAALTASPQGPDAFALGAYADFLLDQNRPQEAIRLLDGLASSDSLLLRQALARNRLTPGGGAPFIPALQARFDAVRLRGEIPHLGEEARFELALRHRPAVAYRLALANWQTMREPRDALTLAECTLALNTPETAAATLDKLATIDINDRRVSLVKRSLRAIAERKIRYPAG
jgi:thioredoxin-like negative regulator of GroEL